ncbi:hypothetical protein COOONC_23154 [Cooperia oncophora]
MLLSVHIVGFLIRFVEHLTCLIVVSPCSQLVLDGQNLRQRRPFPDLFVPAINMIIRECTGTAALNKYIICRLPYSPASPSQLTMLGLPEVEIPSDFSRLTALIHSIDGVYDHRIPPDCSTLDNFSRAVEAMIALKHRDPNWIAQRLCAEDSNVESNADLAEIPKGEVVRLKTDDEREKAAEMFGLLPPEENEMVGDESEFALLPPDED